jgi:uncharacterized membrane protein
MLVIVHAPVLLALIALQFHASGLDKPSPPWIQFRRVLMVAAMVACPICFFLDGVIGTRAAIAALIIAAAGLARERKVEAITRWYRWLALASWCLCLLAALAVIGYLFTRRLFT